MTNKRSAFMGAMSEPPPLARISWGGVFDGRTNIWHSHYPGGHCCSSSMHMPVSEWLTIMLWQQT